MVATVVTHLSRIVTASASIVYLKWWWQRCVMLGETASGLPAKRESFRKNEWLANKI